jgi:SAM-dependent methyltransferase
VGFAGGRDLDHGPWLHGRLAAVAASLVGLDVEEDGIALARSEGFEAHRVDASDQEAVRALRLEPADLVVAGELIEHMEEPGRFLDAVRPLCRPDGALVLTTPNAASLLNPLAAVGRYELINPSHVALYSWFTLSNILERHGWSVTDFVTYHYPLGPRHRGEALPMTALRVLARLQRSAARWWPFVDFGLIAMATPTSGYAGPPASDLPDPTDR